MSDASAAPAATGPDPLRVLVVTNMWPVPDDPVLGIFVHEQVEAVRAEGLDVDVAFVDGRSDRRAYARGIVDVRRRIRAAARGGAPYDVVHAHHCLSAVVALLAGARRGGRPLVVTHHGIEVLSGWQAPLARLVTRVADRTLVISPAMARRLGLPAEAVVPCGVDLARFRPGPKDVARARLGLPPDDPIVAWVGADRPEKRLDLARAAVAVLRADRPRARLLVVSGLAHDEVPPRLQACDALLVTSTFEGGPLVVKEALACGRPVVSTDVGDVRAVTAGVPGCAVVAGTPEALAAGLRAALAHGEVDGRAAVSPYAADAVARRVAGILRALGARRRGRS